MSPGRAAPAKPYRAQRPGPAGPGLITAFRGIMSTGVDAGFARPAVFTGVFALRGCDQQWLAATLERIASIAPRMSPHELRNLACQLGHDMATAGPPGAPGGIAGRLASGAGRARPGNAGGNPEIRVSMTARSRDELAERAARGARLVRGLRGGGPMLSDSGVHVSSGARGRVVLVFPSGVMASGAVPRSAATPAGEATALARSLGAVRWLAGLGVRPAAAVGYGLGELAGLVWAGSLAAPEAARLLAQHGEVRRGLGAVRTAMARVAASEAAAGSLTAACGLAVAAYDGPRSHVLAGPVPAVRELIRQASALGVTADVLDGAHALHTPAMAPCAAPLRSVLSQVRFGPPQRRLVSTVTARELTPDDDIAALLCAQLTSPVRFREAIQLASDGADLIVVAGGDEALTRAAAACGVPAAGLRQGAAAAWGAAAGGPAGDPGAAYAAALLAAGAIPAVAVLSPGRPSRWTSGGTGRPSGGVRVRRRARGPGRRRAGRAVRIPGPTRAGRRSHGTRRRHGGAGSWKPSACSAPAQNWSPRRVSPRGPTRTWPTTYSTGSRCCRRRSAWRRWRRPPPRWPAGRCAARGGCG